MRCIGIIPARMAASRFPGKPLAKLLGITMLEHVYQRSRLCAALDEVIVATCDEAIRTAAQGFGARVVMTSDRHERAMERVAEAAKAVEADVVVLIQGDEPMVAPQMLEELLQPLRAEPDILCTNLMLAVDETEAQDPDQIKVVCDHRGNALYMSREPLPSSRRGAVGWRWRQIGVIAFQRDFLMALVALPETPLERAESVDMLRAIEHGFPVRMVPTRLRTHPVDTPADLERVEAFLRGDALVARYLPFTQQPTQPVRI
jgi:3-deoxy-manno-octulosonate cytidylyltransferase (CMP-KDO synthetase)